jgi:predicted metal-dependent hydrolase
MQQDKIVITRIARSRRKTVALVITRDAALIVRAPYRTPLSFIENLVREKSAWILRKQREAAQRPVPQPKRFVDGEPFLYLGRSYPLRIAENAATGIDLADNLVLNAQPGRAREALLAWYKAEALRIITARTACYAALTGLHPDGIRISNAQKRWGSCSSRKKLNFSWRLAMAPREIIDYLVVHELSHIAQPNHTRLFWNEVGKFLPDYKVREQWLKDHERDLIV